MVLCLIEFSTTDRQKCLTTDSATSLSGQNDGAAVELLAGGIGKEHVSEAHLDSVATVILSWNQRETTLRCLRSLADCGYALSRVFVWDNGSADGTVDAVRRSFPDVIVMRSEKNLGVASGRNAAAAAAMEKLQPTYLLFLDNDMLFTPGFIEALLGPFGGDRSLAQTAAKILQMDDNTRINAAGGVAINFSFGTITPVGYGEIDTGQFDAPRYCLPNGGGTMVRADVFSRLDGFDSIFDPYGPEDIDLSLRARKAGYSSLYIPDAVIYHEHVRSTNDGQFDKVYTSNKLHHWMIILGRHGTPAQKLAFYCIGGPVGLIRVVFRELRQGNLSVLKGLAAGLRRFLFGRRDVK
jgi:GT2 family glycosyltransferase